MYEIISNMLKSWSLNLNAEEKTKIIGYKKKFSAHSFSSTCRFAFFCQNFCFISRIYRKIAAKILYVLNVFVKTYASLNEISLN